VSDVLLRDVADSVATLTMNRPEARNAMNEELILALTSAMTALDQDDAVRVIILTGADPAFCAGLDLKQLGSTGENLLAGRPDRVGPRGPRRTLTWPDMTKPIIAAVNGPAITGGFELALQCDILIASERARFGDTHVRVGVYPGGGMTALLPEAVGIRKAIELSLTGNFITAEEALRLRLVNHVVPHDKLLSTARAIAGGIAGNNQDLVKQVLEGYRQVSLRSVGDALVLEEEYFWNWHRRGGIAAEDVEKRRMAIRERGRQQLR
jgi:enoyl-CoA hydratase